MPRAIRPGPSLTSRLVAPSGLRASALTSLVARDVFIRTGYRR